MKKAGLRSLRKNIRAEKQTVPELIYLLAGIWSVVLVFDYLPYISFSKAAVLAGMMLVCSGMYGVYVFRRELMFQCSAVLLTALGITAVIGRGLLSVQVNAVIESLTDPAVQNETNVTFAVVILSAVLSVCFFIMEIVWKLHTAERQMKIRGPEENKKSSLPVRCSIFMSTLLCVLICVSVIITSVWGTELSGLVYSGEGFVSRSMQRITGAAENPVANGYVSGGNNYRTGATQLEVALQEQPEETLYLKGFTGSEYAGG